MCPTAGCWEAGFEANGVYGVPFLVLEGDGEVGRLGPDSIVIRCCAPSLNGGAFLRQWRNSNGRITTPLSQLGLLA